MQKITEVLSLPDRQKFFQRAIEILMEHFELNANEVYEAINNMGLDLEGYSDDF